ncbi:MAG: hypothetical protein CL608_29150 [Anaerolineaceae bacterium]|nr:hypothetical protein [Anaerolineaceae bacterium]
MDPQIIKLVNIMHSEQTKQAELYHRGIKNGEYYTLMKRTQGQLMKLFPALASLTNRLKRPRYSKSAGCTT